MKIVQMWSGGKDSTCAGLKHIERGDDVHFVCYVPMFDKDIPLMMREHYDFLQHTKDLFIGLGSKVDFVHSITYWDYCTHIITRGARKGCMQGYPCFIKGFCGFNRDSKTPACNDFANTLTYDFKDVGLCADETDRKQLRVDECSILQELGITKQETFEFCKNNGFLSPTYLTKKRDGCSLCPHAKKEERIQWFEDYKEFNAKERLLELQRILLNDSREKGTKHYYPLRGYRYFIENAEFVSKKGTQTNMFNNEKIN